MSGNASTVAALLTPNAPGAIAVIGLAGPCVETVLSRILRRPRDDVPPRITPGVPSRCRVVDAQGVIDDAVVAWFPVREGSRADLCVHGGSRVVQRVLLLLNAEGVVPIEASQFHRLASHDHPIRADVDEVLRLARSRQEAQWLLKQRDLLPEFLDNWESHAATVREDYVRRTQIGIRVVQGLRVALIGPPNSGKSTLANRLLGDERILTSDRPGTTRDWVSETALIAGWPVTLTDTAGVRKTECAVEADAILRGTEQSRSADLALVVLDGSWPMTEQEDARRQLLSRLRGGQSYLVVRNKCDLFQDERLDDQGIAISARTGQGMRDLECRILTALGVNTLLPMRPTGFRLHHLTPAVSA